MANRSFLVLKGSADPNEHFSDDSIIVGASWIVPVLWFSLFDWDDRLMRTGTFLSDPPDDKPLPADDDRVWVDDLTYPVLLTRTEVAQRRAAAGHKAFLTFFPAQFGTYYDRWEVLIAGLDSPYIVLDAGEIWGMGTPDAFDKLLLEGVRAWAKQERSDWIKLCEQTGMVINSQTGQIEEESVLPGRMYGYYWMRPLPWETKE